jgi:hypothetical protein
MSLQIDWLACPCRREEQCTTSPVRRDNNSTAQHNLDSSAMAEAWALEERDSCVCTCTAVAPVLDAAAQQPRNLPRGRSAGTAADGRGV